MKKKGLRLRKDLWKALLLLVRLVLSFVFQFYIESTNNLSTVSEQEP